MPQTTSDIFIPERTQQKLCSVLTAGCDRQTACHFVGLSLAELRAAVGRDPELARRLLRAESIAELVHMHNIRHAAEDSSQWHASAWWLACRAPQRYGGCRREPVTRDDLEAFVDRFAETVWKCVTDRSVRERLLVQIESYDVA